MRRWLWFPLLLLLCALLFPISAGAEESYSPSTEVVPDEFASLLEELPQEILDLLPEELFSEDREVVGDAVAKMSSFPFLLRTCLELLRLRLGDCVGLLASVLAILILSAILKAFTSSLGGDGIGKAFSVLATLSILLALLRLGYGGFTAVTDYLAVLEKMTTASIPLLGTLYALGGNVATATASTAGLSVFLSVLQPFVGKSILPFCGVCLAFSTVNALEPSLRTGTLLGTLKKNYTTLLAFLMMLLLAMLSAQTVLGARGDTLAMRSAKFAASNLIPVVGGSVSELLRTVSASVGYLRGTVGICAVLLLLLALLPTLTELLLLRLSWQICASAADLLSCDTEKKLLDEIASLNGYLIAAVSICSSVLFLALSLLIYCASALG